ncbi:leucine-rich repeat-containing protein 42 isoform X2 [Salmo salar]|uniref:Leucine-rich repeat-containing protein 42 n=1 Tax=Salmo salar TaxID=8030 RepID=A0A1S3M1N2_SALSA|nr:leucine-rich repeat-containing protein 42 isoform X2 [Salmo salar]|eukprot:XP_013996754.1 PREDICTED: leucine-rich repeat-containing protein 42 isoform X2 [Salmo salar]
MGDLDSGIVYVRDRGQLRRVNNIVLAETKPPSSSSSSHRTTNPLALKKEHFVFTYNKEGSLKYTAKSLYDISLLFVAYNINHVDSLKGFPEQVGDRLFAAAEEKQIFSDPDAAPRALQLFSDAYGDIVLGSLCLRHRFPLLSEKLEEIKTFHSLKCLDLFGCRLGDSHDIFQHLTSDALSSLVQLSLGGNSLSDQGLQRLTAPVRMMRRGLRHLQILDLSYNPITEKAVGYLTCLPKLQGLDVSGTNIKVGPSFKQTVRNTMGLVLSEKLLEAFDHSCCKTQGWAEQVVNQWELSATELPKLLKIQESRTSAIRFFGREKFVRGILSASPLIQDKEQDKTRERIHLYKPATSTHTHQTQCTGAKSGQIEHSSLNSIEIAGSTNGYVKPCSQNKKRPRKHQVGDSGRHSPPVKRASSSPALTAGDLDLLNSY